MTGERYADRSAVEACLANRRSYGHADTVLDYVATPYHAVRRDLATEALYNALAGPGAPDGPVMELGCGVQSILGALADTGRQVVCADRELAAVAATKGDRVCLDATRPLPFRNQSFAAIVMAELIEHVYDPVGLLDEAHRVLRPRGILIVTTPNLAPLQDRFRFLFGRSPRQVDPRHPYLRLHIRPFTPSALCGHVAASGFDILSLSSNFVGWQLRSGRWWESRWLAKRFPSLGGSLILCARRRPDSMPRASLDSHHGRSVAR